MKPTSEEQMNVSLRSKRKRFVGRLLCEHSLGICWTPHYDGPATAHMTHLGVRGFFKGNLPAVVWRNGPFLNPQGQNGGHMIS